MLTAGSLTHFSSNLHCDAPYDECGMQTLGNDRWGRETVRESPGVWRMAVRLESSVGFIELT